MKIIAFALTFLITPLFGEDEAIKPMVGSSFGKVMVVEVQFVEKENTYYQQNIVDEPWLAKVISINGTKLKEPVVIEYLIRDDKEKKYANKQIYEFLAYEDIESIGTPHKWTEEAQQIPYMFRQRLVMQEMTRKIRERLEKQK
jgi:hypothetical protein